MDTDDSDSDQNNKFNIFCYIYTAYLRLFLKIHRDAFLCLKRVI